MKNQHTIRAEANEAAIATQEAPAVSKLIFASAGIGALLSALMLLLGAGDPATISMPVFLATPLIPAVCALLVWVPLSFTKGGEARRQSTSAAAVMLVLAIIFFFIDWSARLELSLFFAVMLFAWGARLHHKGLKWAALAYAAVAVGLGFLDIPGSAIIVAILGALTLAWPFVGGYLRRQPAA